MKSKGVMVGLLVLGLLLLGAVGPRPVVAATQQQPAPPEGMVLIPAGIFLMGDSLGEGLPNESPVQMVFLSAFYMDMYLVTKALWDEVAAWAQASGYDIGPGDGRGLGPNHPVTDVTWFQVVKWANARSEKKGLTPCYYTDDTLTSVYRVGLVNVTNEWVNWTANGYRLPAEAEWEKAARGGIVGGRYPWGNDIDCTRANYWRCVGFTSPVGSFAPNGYGLYDMVGNVWEWVWDWYSSELPGGADPRGPGSGSYRVNRGGGWQNQSYCCRVARRFHYRPADERWDLGFRLSMTAP